MENNEKDFTGGIQSYIDYLEANKRHSSAKSYRDAWRSFTRFAGMERIPYTYINKRNLERYEGHLWRAGRSQNTISTYMRRLRCVYYRAVEAGEAPYVPGLFKDVFTGVESRRKRALTVPEMSRMMSAPVKGERLLRARLALCLMFLFGGMAFVDFAHLTAGNLGDGRLLSYKRRKTGVTIRLELPPVAGELAGPLWVEGGKYLFPFLDGEREGKEAYRAYVAALARFNRALRALARSCGVTSPVSSYTIRHTFATTLKERGVPVEVISELLGHTSIRTTQIYLKSFSLERLAEVNRECFESVYRPLPEAA